jgi:hypothetical protein
MGTKKWSEIKKLSKATETDRAEARAELEAEIGRANGGWTIQEVLDRQVELADRYEAFDPQLGAERPVEDYFVQRSRTRLRRGE